MSGSDEEKELPGFEEEVLAKLEQMVRKIDAMQIQVGQLEKKTKSLGVACGQAFQQVRVVIEHLTEAVDGTRQDLSEYGGTITESTWK